MPLPLNFPASQKAGDRPISFILTDNSVSPPETTTLELIIRPEELTRTDASRITVQQTLGGAWIDSFGPGLATINISGTTGWRGNPVAGTDGMDEFAKLRDQTYTDWHRRRNAAVQAGIDPAKVTLVFADALDNLVDIVIPMNFTLRRSKSRPLLMQFNIAMIAIPGDAGSLTISSVDPASAVVSPLTSLHSMQGSVTTLTVLAGDASSFVPFAILGAVAAFLSTSLAVVNAVTLALAAAITIPAGMLATAKAIAAAGATLFAMLAALPELVTSQIAAAMAAASAYSNVVCLLGNAVNQQQVYPDYTPLYCASNCSSTSGGSPVSVYADTNPFYAVLGASPSVPAQAAVTVTPAAQQALAQFASCDPVLAPMSLASMGAAAGAIAAGVALP